ncbi:hypothetical protein STEG23_001265, partial [Scotinomys teguina]
MSAWPSSRGALRGCSGHNRSSIGFTRATGDCQIANGSMDLYGSEPWSEELLLAVAQIMLGLIHSALGTLWFFLYNLENEEDSVGSIGMVVIISYLFVSGSFFINSGSSCIIQGEASLCQVVFSIVMNTISILVSVIGIIIFGIEFPAFESLGIEYIWSNMAGMVLLQISVACTISEMITAIIVSRWFRKVFAQQKLWDEGENGDQGDGSEDKVHMLKTWSVISLSISPSFLLTRNMNPMSPPGPPVNSVYMVAPQNGYPMVPGTVTQLPPPYPSNQPQIHVISGNPPGLVPPQKVLRNGKVLGAIQILIGLVHFGIGSIMITNQFGYYIPVSLYGGFPFWGGIWLNGSVGLNIFSAICSTVGIILLITEMSISGTYTYPSGYPYNYDNWRVGMALSGVLLIFCTLEFSIASVSSHFGCQVACCRPNN